jgi:hypothetical protein
MHLIAGHARGPFGRAWRSGFAAVLAIAGAAAAPAGAQELGGVIGRVTNPAGRPIAGAEIAAVSTPFTTTSDTLGRFRLLGLRAGETILRVRRIGYKAQYLKTAVAPDTIRVTEVALEPGVFELPDLEVTARVAKPIEYAFTNKYDDFFRRRRLGLGTYFGREHIDRLSPSATVDLLRDVPGTRVRYRRPGPGGAQVQFSRCESGHVGVWVDGRKLNWQPHHQQTTGLVLARDAIPDPAEFTSLGGIGQELAALAEVLDEINPREIEMMEVYRGIGSIPAEFRDAGCGAIVIWTRS